MKNDSHWVASAAVNKTQRWCADREKMSYMLSHTPPVSVVPGPSNLLSSLPLMGLLFPCSCSLVLSPPALIVGLERISGAGR